MSRLRRIEAAVAIVIAAIALILAGAAPSFYRTANLLDLVLANVPTLLVAIGATVVILAGEIDISCGSVFALCSVTAGAAAVHALPITVAVGAGLLVGALAGAVNGVLVAYGGVPSIVATLAAMIVIRDALRWATGGAWVQGLPAAFQWLGLPQPVFPFAAALAAAVAVGGTGWFLRSVYAGRTVVAVGSHAEAARLAGVRVARVRLAVFTWAGACTGAGAILNAVRFTQVPVNTGTGLELRVVAAVVVGGTAIMGSRGTIVGTTLGVVLLGLIGPALTFLGASPYWEQALQGAIILTAVVLGLATDRSASRVGVFHEARSARARP